MLNIEEIQREIRENGERKVFDYFNHSGKYDEITKYINDKKTVQNEFIENEKKEKHINYLLEKINKNLGNKGAVLFPIMQNIRFAPSVVLIDKDMSIKEASYYGIPNVAYHEVTKDNFHIYQDILTEFLILSLSFKQEICIPTKNINENKELIKLTKKQIKYHLNEILNSNNYGIDKKVVKTTVDILNDKLSFKEVIEIANSLGAYTLTLNRAGLETKFVNSENMSYIEFDLLRDYVEDLNELRKEQSSLSFFEKSSLESLYFMLSQKTEENEEYIKKNHLAYANLVSNHNDIGRTAYIYKFTEQLLEEEIPFNTLVNKYDRLQEALSAMNIPDSCQKSIDEIVKKLVQEMIHTKDEDLDNRILYIANRKKAVVKLMPEIVNLENIKKYIEREVIIDDDSVKIPNTVMFLKFYEACFFLKNCFRKIIGNNGMLDIIYENPNKEGKGFILFNNKMQDLDNLVFANSVWKYLEYITEEISAKNIQENMVEMSKDYWGAEERKLCLEMKMRASDKETPSKKKI